jgi:hypothetical protein
MEAIRAHLPLSSPSLRHQDHWFIISQAVRVSLFSGNTFSLFLLTMGIVRPSANFSLGARNAEERPFYS